MCSLTVAYTDIDSRLFEQYEVEIFFAHGRVYWLVDVFRGDVAIQNLRAECRFFGVIDGGRVLAVKGEFGCAVKGQAGLFGNLGHALLDQMERLVGKVTALTAKRGFVGDDVVGRSPVIRVIARTGGVRGIGVG